MSQRQTVDLGSQVKEALNVDMLYAVMDKSCIRRSVTFINICLQCDA